MVAAVTWSPHLQKIVRSLVLPSGSEKGNSNETDISLLSPIEQQAVQSILLRKSMNDPGEPEIPWN
jgi:hypothetical protein